MWIASSVELGPGIRFVAPEVQELFVREPPAPVHHLVFHHGDVRRRTAKGRGAQTQEEERQLC
jgi:hypothetical protein